MWALALACVTQAALALGASYVLNSSDIDVVITVAQNFTGLTSLHLRHLRECTGMTPNLLAHGNEATPRLISGTGLGVGAAWLHSYGGEVVHATSNCIVVTSIQLGSPPVATEIWNVSLQGSQLRCDRPACAEAAAGGHEAEMPQSPLNDCRWSIERTFLAATAVGADRMPALVRPTWWIAHTSHLGVASELPYPQTLRSRL